MGTPGLSDARLAELWRRHFEVLDDLVYGVLEGQACAECAARERSRRGRMGRALRRRPKWWYPLKHDYWHFLRVHFPAMVDRLDARREARWERRELERKRGPGAVTLDDLRGARHRLSAPRFYGSDSEDGFRASDPLTEGYVGRLETSFLRTRREMDGEIDP
jgi:hypothetical protein